MFDTPEEAAQAYDRGAFAEWGFYSTLNFAGTQPLIVDVTPEMLAMLDEQLDTMYPCGRARLRAKRVERRMSRSESGAQRS